MSYQNAAFTLDPNFPIPDETAPAIGVEEFGMADAVQQASVQWAGDSAITVDVAMSGSYATVTLTAELTEPYRIVWEWGDGTSETADPGDLVQGHAYDTGGSYEGTFTIEQDGEPSIQGSFPVVC